MLGYKAAKSLLDKHIVITLEIPEDAITNMKRKNIFKAETAFYRTNKAKVIKIEDSEGKIYDEVDLNNKKVKYIVNNEVVSHDFNMNLESAEISGIDFFLSKDIAKNYPHPDKYNGVLESYYEDGRKSYEATNKPHGLETAWFRNGSKNSEIRYVDGIKNGLEEVWYENGTLRAKLPFTNGMLEGVFETWYENGNKQCEDPYKNGKRVGVFRSWHENGNKDKEYTCENGMIIGMIKCWDENGNQLDDIVPYKN